MLKPMDLYLDSINEIVTRKCGIAFCIHFSTIRALEIRVFARYLVVLSCRIH